MAKRLWSIFTDEEGMNRCMITGLEVNVERHHIFSGTDRERSERLGFIAPLHSSLHPNGSRCTATNWTELDHWLKRKCQEYYIEVAKIGDRDAWYREFGRFYDDRCDENVILNKTFEWRLK